VSPPLILVIGNKNYSSWSLRAWAAMTELGIPFEERMLGFETEEWEREIDVLSPSGLVPVLWEGEPGRGFATFDTIAILERVHELFPGKGIWPEDARARSRARSLVADFHAGYRALRGAMPMNVRSRHPGKGMTPEVAKDIERLCALWTRTREAFAGGGELLFGAFCAADAYFLPVASRFATYDVHVEGDAAAYARALLATRAMRAWTEAALEETAFVAMDEPYADSPGPA